MKWLEIQLELISENITNQVDGTLMPPEGPELWPKADSPRQWLVFYRLDQMTMTGAGTIEGNGQKWWELPCKPHRVPTLYLFSLHHFLCSWISFFLSVSTFNARLKFFLCSLFQGPNGTTLPGPCDSPAVRRKHIY